MTKTMLSPTFDMPALEQGVNSSAKVQNQLPGVLIYSPQLLPTVQHYVREHASRLRRYRPVLAGRRRVEGHSFWRIRKLHLSIQRHWLASRVQFPPYWN